MEPDETPLAEQMEHDLPEPQEQWWEDDLEQVNQNEADDYRRE